MTNYLPSSIYREFSSRSSKYFINLSNLCDFTDVKVICKIRIPMEQKLKKQSELNQLSKGYSLEENLVCSVSSAMF